MKWFYSYSSTTYTTLSASDYMHIYIFDNLLSVMIFFFFSGSCVRYFRNIFNLFAWHFMSLVADQNRSRMSSALHMRRRILPICWRLPLEPLPPDKSYRFVLLAAPHHVQSCRPTVGLRCSEFNSNTTEVPRYLFIISL